MKVVELIKVKEFKGLGDHFRTKPCEAKEGQYVPL